MAAWSHVRELEQKRIGQKYAIFEEQVSKKKGPR